MAQPYQQQMPQSAGGYGRGQQPQQQQWGGQPTQGNFNGQTGYGYISFEKFIDAVTAVNEGRVTLDQLDARPLPTLKNTIGTTAILEAGRKSLNERRPVEIVSDDGKWELK